MKTETLDELNMETDGVCKVKARIDFCSAYKDFQCGMSCSYALKQQEQEGNIRSYRECSGVERFT